MENNTAFSQNLIKLIDENKLKLPTQPEVAVRIRECAEDPNLTANKLAQIINHDPALTAKFINMANSPVNRGSVPIVSLADVINRLGLKFVSNTAAGLAMEQLFQTTNENIDQMLYSAWSSSTVIAAYSHVIARNFSSIPVEKAALGGLMNQIGVLPILSYAQDDDNLVENKEALLSLIKDHQASIGDLILKSWKFPTEIASLPNQIYNPHPNEESEISLIDILQAALLKANEENKLLFKIELPSEQIFQKLSPNYKEIFNSDKFKEELEATKNFYCKN